MLIFDLNRCEPIVFFACKGVWENYSKTCFNFARSYIRLIGIRTQIGTVVILPDVSGDRSDPAQYYVFENGSL